MGKVFTSKFVGAGPSSYKERIYQAAVSQRLRNTDVHDLNTVLNVKFFLLCYSSSIFVFLSWQIEGQ